MSILITTTGTQGTITFNDLGGRSFSHPIVDYDISTEYNPEDIRDSVDFQNAIDSGWITVKDENGVNITDLSLLDDRRADANIGIPYTPTVPGNWNTVPDDVKEALDEISSRTKLIESGGGVETDAQQASASNMRTTTSTTLTDIPDMILTTSNTVARSYLVIFSGTFYGNSNRTLTVQLLVNGVPQTTSARLNKTSATNSRFTAATQFLTSQIGNGIEIKAQWSTDGGSMSVEDRSLIIYSLEGI